MNSIIQQERAGTMFGVKGRFFNVVADDATGRIRNQKFSASRGYLKGELTVHVRFDDECKNGHETFSMTADFAIGRHIESCGCLHEDIARAFPKLAHLIKWHLTSTDGPMHYLANTKHLAGNRDCHGLLAGEFKHFQKDGKPLWHIPRTTHADIAADACPEPLQLAYQPYGFTGEGKTRELAAARNSAVWPDATDEELCQEPALLEAALRARLPALLAALKADILAAGFLWPVPKG